MVGRFASIKMAGFANDNWQTELPSIEERTMFIFNKELMSDVKFVFTEANDDGSKKAKLAIPAHKFVLGIGSPVFYAMFYGPMAETTDSIELPDCDYESLLELFRHLYGDDAILSESNVMQVYYLAKKYMVPSLVERCTEHMSENVEGSNVFSVLLLAKKFEEKSLEDRCWGVIKTETTEAVMSDDFVTLERSLVESIVKMERLFVKEVELFKAVDLWSTIEIERRGLTINVNTKRKILGEEIVKAIKFPLMSQKEFMSVVPDSNILTVKEVVDMMKHFSDIKEVSLPFSRSPRSGPHKRCLRFNITSGLMRTSSFNKPAVSLNISFIINKGIFLHGVQFFGKYGGNYIVDVDIFKSGDFWGSTRLFKRHGINISQTYKDETISSISYFDLLFNNPVCLEGGKGYRIDTTINGPPGNYINSSHEEKFVECAGVTFTFKKRAIGNHISCQFPALIFSV